MLNLLLTLVVSQGHSQGDHCLYAARSPPICKLVGWVRGWVCELGWVGLCFGVWVGLRWGVGGRVGGGLGWNRNSPWSHMAPRQGGAFSLLTGNVGGGFGEVNGTTPVEGCDVKAIAMTLP